MSTVGVGGVALGAGVAGVGLATGAIIAGAGIMVARGVMWCGQKMEENYLGACQAWTDAAEAARNENLSRVEVMTPYLMAQLDRLTASAYLSETSLAPQSSVTRPNQEVQEAIFRVRQALSQPQNVMQAREDAELAALIAQLRAEITAGQELLPATKLAQAEQALVGSVADVTAALAVLDAAWNAVTREQALRARKIRQAEQAIAQASARLNAIEMLHRDAGTAGVVSISKARELEATLGKARDMLDYSPEHALEQARVVQQDAGNLLEAVTTASLNEWNAIRGQINTQLGILATLKLLVEEARETQMTSAQQADDLTRSIVTAQREAHTLAEGKEPEVQQSLKQLEQRVDILKKRIFATVETCQQQAIADTVQETLRDLGFHALDGSQPMITRSANVLRVEALTSGGAITDERDDRLVSFDVATNGQVTYDFSGYEGSSCLADAEKVFAALRERGVYILDDMAMKELRKVPADALTLSALAQERFHPRVQQNKSQAELAKTLKRVLAKMYPNVHQTSIGGHIELEAFQGQLGYRVVLSPEGEVEVYKDVAHIDVSNDANDPIVIEAQNTQSQSEQKGMEQERNAKRVHLPTKHSTTSMRKRQQLGQ